MTDCSICNAGATTGYLGEAILEGIQASNNSLITLYKTCAKAGLAPESTMAFMPGLA